MYKITSKIVLGLVLLSIGCTPTTKNDVLFRLENYNSTTINIEYVFTENDDTITSSIDYGESLVLLEKDLEGLTNWYNDYKIHINFITNQANDTINFNPNISSYWFYTTAHPHFYYYLQIDEPSFL